METLTSKHGQEFLAEETLPEPVRKESCASGLHWIASASEGSVVSSLAFGLWPRDAPAPLIYV